MSPLLSSGLCRPAVLLLCALTACSSLVHVPALPPVPTDRIGQRVSRAAATQDVDFMIQTYEHVHVNLYAHASHDSVMRMRDALVAALPDSVTRAELWRSLARIATAFGDGHTSVDPPVNEVIRAVARGDFLLPIRVTVSETGDLIVASLPPGDSGLAGSGVVVSINGHSADSLLRVLVNETSGESMVARTLYATQGFAGLLWLNGIRAPFVVQVRTSDGGAHETRYSVKAPQAPRARTAVPAPPSSGFRYQLQPHNVGYLDFYSMAGDLGAFREEIAKTFAQIAADSVRLLVVDLRRNGGGDTRLGDAFLTHVNDRPYRQDARKDWRASREYRAYLRSALPAAIRWLPVQYLTKEGRQLFSGPDGRVVSFDTRVETPKPSRPFFSGPVCMLIGPGTYSAAADLATAVKDFHLATLIGEETGGIPNSFGEVYPFQLPNTRLTARVSSARFVRASGDTTDYRGVQPDIEVRRTAEDIRAGRDPVLARARECPARSASR